MITNAWFVSIYVKDQERVLDVWTNKLGFELLPGRAEAVATPSRI